MATLATTGTAMTKPERKCVQCHCVIPPGDEIGASGRPRQLCRGCVEARADALGPPPADAAFLRKVADGIAEDGYNFPPGAVQRLEALADLFTWEDVEMLRDLAMAGGGEELYYLSARIQGILLPREQSR